MTELESNAGSLPPGSLLSIASGHQPKNAPNGPHPLSQQGSQEGCNSLLLVSPSPRTATGPHSQPLLPSSLLRAPGSAAALESWRQDAGSVLRFLPPLEMRPSSIAPTTAESREAPADPGAIRSNPKDRQCQRMLKLPHNCTHLTRYSQLSW